MEKLRLQRMKVGDTYVSPSRMVSRTDVETFCNVTGMKAPLFLSDDYVKSDEESKKFGLKGSILPGQLTYAVFFACLGSEGLVDDVIMQLGANDLRWPAPAYPYDSLRAEVEVIGNRTTKAGNIVVDYKWQVKNQNDVVVMEATNTCMFRNK